MINKDCCLAVSLDQVLKRLSPPNCPSNNRPQFELVIKLKTTKQIGATIPPTLLARADRVIR
jgi:putative ABC transport system substrate-binding protein